MKARNIFVVIFFLTFGKIAQCQTPPPGVVPSAQPFSRPDNTFFNPATLTLPATLNSIDSPIVKATVCFGARNSRYGTGLHLGNGLVITNAHVLGDVFGSSKFAQTQGKDIDLGFPTNFSLYRGGKIEQLPNFNIQDLDFLKTHNASFEAALHLNDWALVKLPELNSVKSEISLAAPESTLLEGETVWVFGYPFSANAGLYVAAGELKQDIHGSFYIRNIQLQGGFSGGPVVRADGQVIGLVNTYFKDTGYATMVPMVKILPNRSETLVPTSTAFCSQKLR